MRLLALDALAIADAAQEQLVEVAEKIAAEARRGYAQSELRTADKRRGVTVESDESGVRVVTYNSFAHFDEWGGGEVRSTPTGAMRSAAARAGRFREA